LPLNRLTASCCVIVVCLGFFSRFAGAEEVTLSYTASTLTFLAGKVAIDQALQHRGFFVLRESDAVRRNLIELVLPHWFDRGVQPLSRILDIGLIRNHDRLDVRTPAIFH
jgi:hypothetical protein